MYVGTPYTDFNVSHGMVWVGVSEAWRGFNQCFYQPWIENNFNLLTLDVHVGINSRMEWFVYCQRSAKVL